MLSFSHPISFEKIKNMSQKIPSIGTFIESIHMAKNTSILLGDHFDQFISEQILTGRYGSASEVVRTALRLLESEELKKKELNKALSKGEKSGFDKNFDAKEHLQKLKRNKA
jgi:antitoxin ParD1/3/4